MIESIMVIVRDSSCDSEVFATLRLAKVNAGRPDKNWHGLTVIITTLTGVPERELDNLLSDWREARPEDRQAAVAAMRVASYQGCLDAGRKRFQGTDDEIVHQERQRRGKLGMLNASINSGFEGSDDQIRTLQVFKNLMTVACLGGKIDMSLPEPKILGLQAEQNLLTAARNGGKIDMSLPEPKILGLQAEQNLLTAARNRGKIDMSLPEPQIRGLQAKQNLLTAACNGGKIDMSLPKPQILGLQAEQNLLTAVRNGGKIDMSLPEPQIQGLQTEQNLLTAARNRGKIDMSLSEPQIRGLQAEQNLLTAARNGGKIDMSLPELQIRRQAMALMRGSSVEELAARDAVQSKTTFAATEDDRYLDVMLRVEFEAAGKILDDHSDRSAIASIVKAKSIDKEMKRVTAQVR